MASVDARSDSSFSAAAEAYGPGDGEVRFAPRIGTFAALRRHWALFLLPLVLLAAGGVAYGLVRTPTYTARTELTTGRLNLSQPGALSGFATATEALASNYSRNIDAQPVLQRIAGETGMTLKEARQRLSATPIPDSPIFRVQATADSGARAIRVANLATDALLTHIGTDGSRLSQGSQRLLRRYRDVQGRVNEASRELAAAKARYGSSVSAAAGLALSQAQGRLQAAKLRAQALAGAYQQSVQGRGANQAVEVVTRATYATSDRRSKTEIAGFAGLLVGGLLGAALATLRANALLRRSRLLAR